MVDGLFGRHASGALAELLPRVQVAVEAREVARADLEPDPVADEIGATVEFLLSEGAGYMTGQTLHVNGGIYLPG